MMRSETANHEAISRQFSKTTRLLSLFLVLVFVSAGALTGCAQTDGESRGASSDDQQRVDDKNAAFATGGKADSLTTAEIRKRVLHIANTYSFQELDAFLHQYAARGIVDRRERHGRYESLRDLDKAYYVGPYAFRKLVEEARSLPDDALGGGDNGDEDRTIDVDRSGTTPVVVLSGGLAQTLEGMFDRVYRYGTQNAAVSCDGSGSETSCRIPVGEADQDPSDASLAIRFRGGDGSHATHQIYRATRRLGEYVRSENARVYERFHCRPHNNHTCEITADDGSNKRTVVLNGGSSVIPKLGSSRIWEGWLIVDGNPVSTGHFRAQSNTSTYEFEVDAERANKAKKFVLTIEPADEPEGTPSDQKYLAGPIQGDSATITTTRGPSLSGVDLSNASGVFFLAAPSGANVPATDYRNGIWYIDNSSGSPSAGLDLPTLGDGWTYEGWVVKPGEGPVSTGRFDDPASRDSDGGGPFAGPAGTPPLPGQDFVAADGRRDLTDGYKTVISVEPQPDDSPKPFAVKPLAAPITDDGAMTLQQLPLNQAGLPEATVEIR